MAFTYITGSGTQSNPYSIGSNLAWNEWASHVFQGNSMEGEYVELNCDLDGLINSGNVVDGQGLTELNMPSASIEQSGLTGFAEAHVFQGFFDGKNHTIKNYSLPRSSICVLSLGNNASLKNISLLNIGFGERNEIFKCVYLVANASSDNIFNAVVENVCATNIDGHYKGVGSCFAIRIPAFDTVVQGNINISKCFYFHNCIHSQKTSGKSFVKEYFDGNSSQAPNHQIKINISDCVIIDSVLASANSYVARSTNGTFNLNNVLAYFLSNDIDGVGSDLDSLPDAHYYGEIKNCYLACSNDCVNIKDSFNPVFSRINREQCLSSSTFSNWDFSSTWKIDSKMGFPVPEIFSERYVYLYYRRREETMLCLESGNPPNRSPGFNLRGFYGMVERGSDVSFGMVSLFGGSWKSFMEVRNVHTNALPDDDFVDYNNIQESVIKEYTIKPFFTDGTGEGTPDNPFKINNFQDYVSSVYLTTLELCFNGIYHDINQAKTFYCSIEQDIICNDISDFNEWDNRRPANVLDLENLPGRSDFYLSGGMRNCYDGKNHKIIGLCGKSSSGVPSLGSFANTSVVFKNTVFDYIYGYFSSFAGASYESLVGRFERCEFNGMFYFNGSSGYYYCNECSFNLLPSINLLGDSYDSYSINTILKNSSSYVSPRLYATDCVFNGGFAELSGYYQHSSYTSCVFYGKYKQLYGNRTNSSLQLSNCYFIDEDVCDKQDFEGAIFLTREQYNEASNFSLDFDSKFEMNADRGGPVLRGMAPRFKIFTALNLDRYGLTSVSKYKYFASNNETVTLNVTVIPNSLSHFSQWSDGDKSNPRTIVLDKDMVLAYKLPPLISGLDGDGTEQSPYLIKTKANLNRLVSYCNSAPWYNLNDVYVKQTEDIIYQDTTEWATWEQLGAPETFTPFEQYKGIYDGDGHSISGLYIQGENRTGSGNQTYVTFMDTYDNVVHIKNLTIKESLYVNTPKVRCYMSGFMYGVNEYSTVENCTFSGELYSEYSGDMAGIYVGTAPTIKKCTFKGKIINKSGGQVLAGIAVAITNGAYNQKKAIIEQCASAGTIELSGVPNITSSTNFQYYGVAGIAGLNSGYGGYFTITECYNATEIKGIKNVWVSGICNLYKGSLYISDCYNIGDIESQAQSQTVADLSEFNCSGIANVTSDLYAYIERCYNYGTIVCLDTNGENKSGYAVSPRRGSQMENCFYLINTGKNTIDSIKPLSAVEFSQASNFTGFNFVKIWQMDASEGRPKLIANMEYGLLNLLLSVSNKDYGIVSGGGRYEYGSEVTIVATPYSGCSFRQWSDGGRKNPRKIVLTSNQQLQAIFKGGVPIRLLDYFGLVQFWTNIQMYFAGMLARKVDKIQAGDEDTPVYFNANGVPTVCTSLDLDTTGNADSATKLANAVNIAGVPFDGTQDISINKSNIGLSEVENKSPDEILSVDSYVALMTTNKTIVGAINELSQSGGGSTVSYVPAIDSGTEIGTLTIDGNENKLYYKGGGSDFEVLSDDEIDEICQE